MRAGPSSIIGTVTRRALSSAVLAVLVAAVLAIAAGGRRPTATTDIEDARVVRVVDGDTIVARSASGATERVRLIGVDTPESVKPGTPVQCFALKASAHTKHLLTGKAVRLVGDAEARDRYGRLLAYVYREPDGLFVNADLVRRGYAQTLTIPPNVRFAERFLALARQARDAGVGLWGAC
jgi:micrococcal nuclease